MMPKWWLEESEDKCAVYGHELMDTACRKGEIGNG
jgi:hypothetical protein